MNDIVLKKANSETFATSLLIAEKFGKRHKDVIRKIENLNTETRGRLKIALSSYLNRQNKEHKMYLLNGMQLTYLASAEYVCSKALHDGMDSGLPYKSIYKLAHKRVEAFSSAVGKPPALQTQ